VGAPSSQIRLLLVEDVTQVAQYIRNLLNSQDQVMVNRADSAGGIDPRAVAEQLVGEPEFQLVSDGRLVVEANNQGVPFVLVEPEAPISKQVADIATRLLKSRAAAVAGAR